jgi:hypothetical protein
MKSEVATGKNRTGIEISPIDKREVLDIPKLTRPSMEGDETVLDEVRAEYLSQHEKIGSVPPPANLKGAAGKVIDAVKGANVNVLVDKLGERLGFERTGTRLYEALVVKCQSGGESLPGGPTVEALRTLQREELAHFEIVKNAIVEVGGDPTALTPSADVAAVMSMGVLQVIADPRMTLKQSLEAILVAELVDNAAWELLIQLARSAGHDAIARKFEPCLAQEQQHLAKVRGWVAGAIIGAAQTPRAKA